MLLPTLIFLLLDSGFEYMSNKIPNEIPKYLYRRFNTKKKMLNRGQPHVFFKINKVSDDACQCNGHDVVISIGGICFYIESFVHCMTHEETLSIQ